MRAPSAGVGAWRLGTRLFVAQAVVLVAIVSSAGLTAALIGPPLFHAHLIETGHPPDSPEIVHIERAFADASMISLTVGLLVALAAALGDDGHARRRARLLLLGAGRGDDDCGSGMIDDW